MNAYFGACSYVMGVGESEERTLSICGEPTHLTEALGSGAYCAVQTDDASLTYLIGGRRW